MADRIVVENVVKTYPGGTAPALDGVSVTVADGEFFTLLGPSGCGKTTLLRCIAGLESPGNGCIRIGAATVFDAGRGINVTPNRRNVGMVFQSYAIWPHMTVFENVAFPLRCRGSKEVRSKVHEALDIVGLAEFAERYSSRLSGGQQQRVALARALVARPDVMLLDEPLSNLDAALRDQMRAELRRLQKEIGITTVFVTHDQDEALSMSDRIAVFDTGRILEVGTPRSLYHQPMTHFAAHFIGGANMLVGAAERQGNRDIRVETEIGSLISAREYVGRNVVCFVRPESVRLFPERPESCTNCFDALVRDARFIGHSSEYDLSVTGNQGDVHLRARDSRDLGLGAGDRCYMQIDPVHVHFVSAR